MFRKLITLFIAVLMALTPLVQSYTPVYSVVTDIDVTQNYTGDGVEDTYSFTFKYVDATDIEVYVSSALVAASAYTLTKDADGVGGTVVFDTAPANTAPILIQRVVPYTQATRLPNVDRLSRDVLENTFDKTVMQVQQLRDTQNRSFSFAATSTTSASVTVPDPSADAYLGWNSGATALENKVSVTGTTLPAPDTANTVLQVNSGGTAFEIGKVDTENLAAEAVDTAAIEDGAVTAAKLASGAVTNPGYVNNTAAPVYATAATFTVAHISAMDSTRATLIEKTTSTTVDLSTSGLNGLDTGSEANSTWYYVYAISKAAGADPGLILSVTNEAVSGSITFPTDYTLKRQLPFAIRNDGSGNIIQFYVGDGWPSRPVVHYQVQFTDYGGTVGATNVLDGGTATSFTDIDLSSFVPPISTLAYIKFDNFANAGIVKFRQNGHTATEGYMVQAGTTNTDTTGLIPIQTDSSQVIEYDIDTAGDVDVAVEGFVVTEVN